MPSFERFKRKLDSLRKDPVGWRLLFEKDLVVAGIDALANRMLEGIPDIFTKELKLVCILEGSRWFSEELAKRLREYGINVEIVYISVKSYYGRRQGQLQIIGQDKLFFNVGEVNVVISDDMIDKGKTQNAVVDTVLEQNPGISRTLFTVTMCEKPDAYLTPGIPYDVAVSQLVTDWICGLRIDGGDKKRLGEEDGRNLEGIYRRLKPPYLWLDIALRNNRLSSIVLNSLAKIVGV